MTKAEFIVQLYQIHAIQFGSFVLKSGTTSPFYFNLRNIISYPPLLCALSTFICDEILKNSSVQHLVGVPYAGIPIASYLSSDSKIPLLIPRKETKSYGSKDDIIGNFTAGDSCLIVEDIITSGESILETAEKLKEYGLVVTGAIAVIDRSVFPGEFEQRAGIRLHSLFTLDEIVSTLFNKGILDSERHTIVRDFIKEAQERKSEPIGFKGNILTQKLTEVMEQKNSRLILSLDVDTQQSFFRILEDTAPEICMVKTHVDILNDYTEGFTEKLQEYAQRYNFLIFEDRKFADIGNTVRMQFRGGIHKISEWAEFVTVHLIAGEYILNGLFDGLENRSSFLLAKMSAKNNLISEEYTRKVLEIGKKYPHVVSGFIGHGKNETDIRKFKNKIPPGYLLLMPGVQIGTTGDSMGQTYLTPQTAIAGGADAIIVGRGITEAKEPGVMAREYRLAAPFIKE